MHYGGEFCLVDQHPERTALSLVFVQSQDGNTGGADPASFGGGATDKHLIYEGLSRVAADAVLAGPEVSIGTPSSQCGIPNWSPYEPRSVCLAIRPRSSYRSAAGST